MADQINQNFKTRLIIYDYIDINFHSYGINAEMWHVMGSCMFDALNSVCKEYAAPHLWPEQEQNLWSDFISTTFDIAAQRCLQVKPAESAAEQSSGILYG